MTTTKKSATKIVELPFEIGKTYKTKFQTGDLFRITKLVTRKFLKQDVLASFEGIYIGREHLGDCPLALDRLIPETTTELYEIDVCKCCGKPL